MVHQIRMMTPLHTAILNRIASLMHKNPTPENVPDTVHVSKEVPGRRDSSSPQRRRSQMKTDRSSFPLIIAGLAFLGLLVLGIPMTGLAQQTPHPCQQNGTTHLGTALGSSSIFDFFFDTTCPTNSFATVWTVRVYNVADLINPLPPPCSVGPVAVPAGPGPFGPVHCTGLQQGPANQQQVMVVISFERLIGGPMVHTHYFYNPQ